MQTFRRFSATAGFLTSLALTGCQSAPSQPYVVATDTWVQYNAVPVKGIYGKTADGKFLCSPERLKWEENLAIENESLKQRLEQERISHLSAPAK